MPKLITSRITKDDIKEFLQGNDDFRLEIAALKALKRNEISHQHGGTYVDHVTGRSRQFDLRAKINRKNYFIDLAIECKNLSNSFPLLVSTLPRSNNEVYHEITYGREPHKHVIPFDKRSRSSFRIPINQSQGVSIYQAGQPCGKATNQIGRLASDSKLHTDDGQVYEKWAQAFASANELVENSFLNYQKQDHNTFSISFILPILVLNDDVLWQAQYSKDGNIVEDPLMVDQIEVYSGKEINIPLKFKYTFSHLHIFTIRGFEAFLEKLTDENDNQIWEALFPKSEITAHIENLHR